MRSARPCDRSSRRPLVADAISPRLDRGRRKAVTRGSSGHLPCLGLSREPDHGNSSRQSADSDRAAQRVNVEPVERATKKPTDGKLRPWAMNKRWRGHRHSVVRRRKHREIGGRIGSHDGVHTIVVSRGCLSAFVCGFHLAWFPFPAWRDRYSRPLCTLQRCSNGFVTPCPGKT